MRFDLETSEGKHQIQAYELGQIKIDNEVYDHNIIVTPTQITSWEPTSIAELTQAHLEKLTTLTPDVLLLGTGEKQIFLPLKLLQPLFDKHIGYEIMATAAACRTYNILIADGRHVVAALILR